MAKNTALVRSRTRRKRVALLQKGYKWSYVNKMYPLAKRRRYPLYKTPYIKPGTVATTKFVNTWTGEVTIGKPEGALYCPHAILFNPLIGNFITRQNEMDIISRISPATITRNTDMPLLPTRDADFVHNYAINPYANQNFRKFLTMYQEMRVDYVMVKLTPVSSYLSGLNYPVEISHFVDRKYTSKGGSPIDRYTNLVLCDKSAFEQDFASQGKRWVMFDTENRGARTYKVYLQATGLGEKSFISTETLRYLQNYNVTCEPPIAFYTEFMGFYNATLSPYVHDPARVANQKGFTPTIAFMLKTPTGVSNNITIKLRYSFKIGYSFRNPGNWNDGTAYDWKTYNWLNTATNVFLEEKDIYPPSTTAHDRTPAAQDVNIPIYDPFLGRQGDQGGPRQQPQSVPAAAAADTTEETLQRTDTLMLTDDVIPDTPRQ